VKTLKVKVKEDFLSMAPILLMTLAIFAFTAFLALVAYLCSFLGNQVIVGLVLVPPFILSVLIFTSVVDYYMDKVEAYFSKFLPKRTYKLSYFYPSKLTREELFKIKEIANTKKNPNDK
jgi:hypothetical protein